MEGGTSLSKIAKISCIAFVFYVFWFSYAFRKVNVILYATVFVAVGCMAFDLWFYQRDIKGFCPMGVLINLVMVFYSLITGVWVAVSESTVVSLAKTYAAFTAICIVICYISKEEDSIDWIVNGMIALCIVVFVFQNLRGYPIPGYGYVLGPEQNPNMLALVMNVGLFCLAYKSRNGTKHIGWHLLLAVMFMYSVINSGSRKCLIAAGIIIVLWLMPLVKTIWKSSGQGTHILMIAAAVLIAAGVVYYFTTVFVNTDIYQRMMLLGDEDEFSSRNRKLYYQYALDYFQEQPIFGIGLGQFQLWNPFHQMSHSTYAESISCWGFVGCLIYYIPVVGAIFQAVRLSFSGRNTYVPRIVLAVLIMELFLGVGQVWFYEIEHLITWTLIYFILSDLLMKENPQPRRTYKYVKA